MAAKSERIGGWEAELIDAGRVAHLGTNAASGWPHLVPVCYARIGDTFYIPIDEKPKASRDLARMQNITRDPRATLVIDRYDDAWQSLAWVRVECRARVVERGAGEPAALAQLRNRYAQYQAMPLEDRPMIVLDTARTVSWRWER